jgi:porin
MNTTIKASLVATVLTALFVFDSGVRAQDATPPPSRPSSEPATDKLKGEQAKNQAAGNEAAKTDADKAAAQTEATAKPPQAAATTAKPAPPPEDFWHQGEATGNWGGIRSKWKDKGFEMEISLTQFFQGIASGGIDTGRTEYNGTFQTLFKFDFGKMFGWKFWSAEIKTETRFGGPLLGGTGTINPVNTSAIIPGANNTLFSVTAVNMTKLFPINLQEGKLFALSFGRYNLVDLVDEDFFAGGGTERFLNIAPIGPLTVLREVPLITNAVSFAYIRKGEPFITFALIDPNDYSLEPGLAELYEDGVTFAPGINFSVKHFGKTAKHTFSGAITTKKYTPFDIIRQIIIPGPPINPVQPERGSGSVSYTFRQYLVERGKRDGWGFFSQLSFANKNTSPITVFFNAGIGGNGLFKNRSGDEFGFSYAYTDLSEVLKDNIDLPTFGNRRLLPEHQVEMFYNLHITPWLRLTGDLQVIRPSRPIADTAIVPGVRLKIFF